MSRRSKRWRRLEKGQASEWGGMPDKQQEGEGQVKTRLEAQGNLWHQEAWGGRRHPGEVGQGFGRPPPR